VLLAALMTPPVREWCRQAGLVWPYLVGLGFAAAYFAVPIVRAYAVWRGVLDQPSARKVHAVATPLLGGAAVYFAFALTVIFNFSFSRELKGVALGATIVVAVGILDDLMDLSPWLKLIGQIAAATVAIAWGVGLNIVPNWLPGFAALNVVLTLLWFLTVTNAVQFLDGMDGLATGLGAIGGLFFSITALHHVPVGRAGGRLPRLPALQLPPGRRADLPGGRRGQLHRVHAGRLGDHGRMGAE
jgi:UDP-N-acetylmuramyl pentapeptide phosphotransferase/UDP-N-acetylglucosamine-1-phosphate transferase